MAKSDTRQHDTTLPLWLDLHCASESGCGNGQHSPWKNEDSRVCQTWEQTTPPKNSGVLENWLSQTASPRDELWAQQALQSRCRWEEEA
jgi:hypothetical protein